MLTPEQEEKIAVATHVDLGAVGVSINKHQFLTGMQAAYAAGEADMRERAARVCRDVEAENCVPPLNDFEASECEKRINALRETK